MRVVYQTIRDDIDVALEKARKAGRRVNHIVVTQEELQELCRALGYYYDRHLTDVTYNDVFVVVGK